jgi:uncharacterized damage-inducible protein DinB
MDLLASLRRQLDYDAWANREVLAALAGAAAPPEKAVRWFAHILAAERLWLERLRAGTASVVVWPAPDLDRSGPELDELERLWRDYLGTLTSEGLGAVIPYVNSKGEPWTSRVEDVLQHVVMHSAYHRGQIAAALREAGIPPAATDFIHAVRQGVLE